MTGVLRPFLLTCGLLVILLSSALTLARSGADGAYWLLSPRDEINRSGLYIQEPDEGARHMMHGFDESMTFRWWSDDQRWIYFRTVAAFDADFYSLNLFRMRVGGRRRECVGRKLARLGGEPYSDFTPAPVGEWVAYVTPEWEPNRLYVTRNDCVNPTRVFESDTEIVDSLFWSPDGEWLYFHTRDEYAATSWLHRVRPDGGDLELLTQTLVDPNFTNKTWEWSPDGAWVLLRSCGVIDVDFYAVCSLYTFSADGGAHSHLGSNALIAENGVWTDDGQWIIHAIGGQTDIFRSRPDGSQTENLTHLPDNESVVAFTTHHDQIVFTAVGVEAESVYLMRPDGTERQLLAQRSAPLDVLRVEAVVDDWIYLVEYDSGAEEWRLYRLQFDGSQKQPLVTGNLTRIEWHLSPDNTHLMTNYYNRTDEESVRTLFRMRLDGSEQQHVPLVTDMAPQRFSPLFNMRWRVGWLVLVGAALLTFHAILTKVPTPFDGRQHD